MDDLITTWDNLPTWAKWAIPLAIVGIILLIWQPWKKKSSTTTLPSGVNSGYAVAPISNGSSPISNGSSPVSNGSSPVSNGSAPTYHISNGSGAAPTNYYTPPSNTTTHKIGQISTTFTNKPPNTNATTYKESVVPSTNTLHVTNTNTGKSYNQTLNSYFTYLHNPVGALGSKYTPAQHIADTLFYHYGIKNQSQLASALNNSNSPAHNTAVEFHHMVLNNAG